MAQPAPADGSPPSLAPDGQRRVPLRVICPGLPRTGTASMHAALTTLGFAPAHHGFTLLERPARNAAWERAVEAKFFGKGAPLGKREFDEMLLGDIQAVTDMPCACFAEEFVKWYPDAKVVLVEREIEAWYKSFDRGILCSLFTPLADFFTNYIEPRIGSIMGRMCKTTVLGFFDACDVDEVRRNMRAVYAQHYARIRACTPPDRLLEYNLGDGWAPLCAFLGADVPDVPFPRINETDALRAKIREIQARNFKSAVASVAPYGAPAVVVVVAAAWWYLR